MTERQPCGLVIPKINVRASSSKVGDVFDMALLDKGAGSLSDERPALQH